MLIYHNIAAVKRQWDTVTAVFVPCYCLLTVILLFQVIRICRKQREKHEYLSCDAAGKLAGMNCWGRKAYICRNQKKSCLPECRRNLSRPG